MTLKINQRTVAREIEDGITTEITEPGTNITALDQAVVMRRCRLTLAGAVISVAAADDYGSVKICDLPDKNLHIHGVEVDCTVVKGGVTNGIVAATDLDMSVGTAAASATTLATTMLNIIEKVDIDTNALSVEFEAHSNDNATYVAPLAIVDGASSALYMNAVAVGGITADDTLTVTGTIDIFYTDLGNLAS
jgi:hypothetical protein